MYVLFYYIACIERIPMSNINFVLDSVEYVNKRVVVAVQQIDTEHNTS